MMYSWRLPVVLAIGTVLAPWDFHAGASSRGHEDAWPTQWSAAGGSRASAAAQGANDLFGDRLTAKRKKRRAGITPIPAPTTPTLDKNFGWWGDEVTFSAQYLDPIPYGNLAFMFDRPVRATETSGGNPYATWAKFRIPEDARSFGAVIQAHGLSNTTVGSVPFFFMVPRGIGPFPDIHGVVWAPSTGKVWVAAGDYDVNDGIIQELDVFLPTPTAFNGRRIPGVTKPYISRVTADGRMLYVDGCLGVVKVYQVTVSNGATTSSSFHQYSYTIAQIAYTCHDVSHTLEGGDHGGKDQTCGAGVAARAKDDAQGTGPIENSARARG